MTHRRSPSLCASLAALALLMLVSWPDVTPAQTPQASSGNCDCVLRQFKLVSPGSGWATTGPRENAIESDRLYWTDNNGEAWRDITPPDMPARSITQIFFLDRSHAWMLSSDALGDQKDARFYLLSTEDGAKHWRTLMLQRPMFKLMDDYYFPTQLFFSDPQHGWMLWHWHVMNGSLDALLATTDGGRTWKRLDDPPGSGPVQFLSASDGWMIGGPEDREGMDPEDIQLWRTHDGGASWRPVPIPIPKNSDEEGFYLIALRFRNMREGMVAAGLTRDAVTYGFANCFTRDGGKTWRFSQFNALSAEPSIGKRHIFWSAHDRAARGRTQTERRRNRAAASSARMDNEVISLALPAGVSSEGILQDFDFLDDSNAWVKYLDGPCFLLIATTDRGNTSKLIWPPAQKVAP